MGQRTVIVVKKIDRYGKTSLKLVHHQWGFGKVMPSMFMSEFLACTYNNNKNKYSNKLKDFFNFTNNKNLLYNCKGLKSASDIFSKEFLQKIYKRTDNNNGGMILEITEKPLEKGYDDKIYDRGFVEIQNIKLGFVLGCEECKYNYDLGKYIGEKPFERLVSPREYMEKTGGESYCPKEYIEIFENFCKYWDIDLVIDTEV